MVSLFALSSIALVHSLLGAASQGSHSIGLDVSLSPGTIPSPGTYSAKASTGHSAWVVKGSNFTLDLTGRKLVAGRPPNVPQEQFVGTGILLDGCKNVTIKNADVAGFQFNIVVRNCQNTRILNCVANSSRAIRMSTEGKPIDTFLNVRSDAAWRTYGAGIWMEKCEQCQIRHCTAQYSQNGIIALKANRCVLFDNQCSYNGGWGIALNQTSQTVVAWNHADFCNRPWGGGWGGDASGIVVTNDCNSNEFLANSLTHGGDGFFLTDSVNGGFNKETEKYEFAGTSNRNMVAFNDGSWSSNNAFEGTFATSNTYYKNIADDSNYGFWLGFSSHSFVIMNEIMQNRSEGIAINQGQSNTIFRNQIERNRSIGVHIWSNPGSVEQDQPSDQNEIIGNRIVDSNLAVSLERSTNYRVLGNTIEHAKIPAGVITGFPALSETVMLSSWVHRPVATKIDMWIKQRPAGWKFYRETALPKGEVALKMGDYSPRP